MNLTPLVAPGRTRGVKTGTYMPSLVASLLVVSMWLTVGNQLCMEIRAENGALEKGAHPYCILNFGKVISNK